MRSKQRERKRERGAHGMQVKRSITELYSNIKQQRCRVFRNYRCVCVWQERNKKDNWSVKKVILLLWGTDFHPLWVFESSSARFMWWFQSTGEAGGWSYWSCWVSVEETATNRSADSSVTRVSTPEWVEIQVIHIWSVLSVTVITLLFSVTSSVRHYCSECSNHTTVRQARSLR